LHSSCPGWLRPGRGGGRPPTGGSAGEEAEAAAFAGREHIGVMKKNENKFPSPAYYS